MIWIVMLCIFLTLEFGLINLPFRISSLLYLLVYIVLIVKWILSPFLLQLKYWDREIKKVFYLVFIFLLYYGLMIALNLYSYNPFEILSRYQLIAPFVAFLLIITFVDTKKKFGILIYFILLCLLVGTMLSILHATKKDSFLTSSPYYAFGHSADQFIMKVGSVNRTMLPSLYIIEPAFILFLSGFFITQKKWMFLFSIFLLPAVFLGYTRSHWLGIFLTLILCYIIISYFKTKYLRQNYNFLARLVVGVILGFAIIGIFISFGNNFSQSSSPFISRISSGISDISGDKGTFGTRVITTESALSIWQQSPYLGLGPYYMEETKWFQLSDVGVIYTLVTLGVIGLVLFLILLFQLSNCGYKIFKIGVLVNDQTQMTLGLALFSVPIYVTIALQTTQTSYLLTAINVLAGLTVQYTRLFDNISNYNSTFQQ